MNKGLTRTQSRGSTSGLHLSWLFRRVSNHNPIQNGIVSQDKPRCVSRVHMCTACSGRVIRFSFVLFRAHRFQAVLCSGPVSLLPHELPHCCWQFALSSLKKNMDQVSASLKDTDAAALGHFLGKSNCQVARELATRDMDRESERERYDQRDQNWGTMGNSSFELWLGAVRSASKRLRPLQNVLQGCSRHFYARCCKADMWKTPSIIGTSPKI